MKIIQIVTRGFEIIGLDDEGNLWKRTADDINFIWEAMPTTFEQDLQ